MIVVKVELWPHGHEHRKRELAVMHVMNVGGTDEFGDYRVEVGMDRSDEIREGVVKEHPRLTSSVWSLVVKALKSVGVGA